MHSKENLLRVQVKNQRGILQTHRVAADRVVDLEVTGGERRLTPGQEDGGGTVGLGVHVVWRRWRRHESIPHRWMIVESDINLLEQFFGASANTRGEATSSLNLQTHPGVLMVWSAW